LGNDVPHGIAYDPSTGNYYIVSNDNLYLFNITTRVATFIGSFGVPIGLMIDMAITSNGTAYAYNIETDASYTVDLTTGAATMLGALGYDAGFGQGASVDYSTGAIYFSAFNVTTNTEQLRTLNTSTGGTNLIVDWGFEQVAPFAIDNLNTGIENENEMPSSFSLIQNFPNPFNPTTTIKYQIPELSFVTIKVYDVLGNEITTLVNEEKPIGIYTIEFDASNLPSGIYFYKLQSSNFTQTKKMILQK
jgi:hypothetical protein